MTTQAPDSDKLYALAQPDAKINVVVVYNPLDISDRTVGKVDWEPTAPLARYLEDLPPGLDWGVAINGEPIDRDKWEVFYPQAEDSLVLMPVPHGGGSSGSKDIIRLVAIIAVAVVAWEFAPALAGAIGVSQAAAFGIISVAGSLLVSALIPPAKANVSGGLVANTQTDGLTYGIDGPKNTSAETTPIQIVYGNYRVAGNIVDQRVDNIGDTQLLYVRSVIGEGPIDSVDPDSLQIQEQRRTDFNNVDFDYRLGTDNQTVTDWFNQTNRQINKGVKILTAFTNFTSETQIEGLRVDLVFPNGLVFLDNQGNRGNASVTLQMQYSPTGTNQWIPITAFDDPAASTRPTPLPGEGVQDFWVRLTQWLNGLDFVAPSPTVTITDAKRAAVRRSYLTGPVPSGIYDFRMLRTSLESSLDTLADSVFLSDIGELINEPVAYNFTAWFAIKVQLNDQLNQVPTVTVQVKGRVLDHYDAKGNFLGNFWDNNPAWVALDLMMHPRYGGGLTLDRIDIAKIVQWADYCTSAGLTFNGIFDTQGNLWDTIQVVLRVGHANIVMIGTRYSIAVEMPDIPTQMFSVGNIVKDTFQIDWLSLADRANEIELQYFDEADSFRQHMVRAIDLDALAQGKPQKLASMTMIGVTSNATAYKEAWFQLSMNKFILQTVTFDAYLDGIACLVGDLVYVQHDMPQWGFGGRILAGSTASVVNMDRPVELITGRDYRLLVTHAAVKRVPSIAASIIAGNSVLVAGDIPMPLKRLKFGSQDLGILSVNPGNPFTEIVLDRSPTAAGLAAGMSVELWDTDVIEERTVVNAAGTTPTGTVEQLTLATPLSVVPAEFSNYMFGENLKMKKIFRVKQIQGTQEYTRTITAFEYNESIYKDPEHAAPTPNFSALSTTIGQVLDLQVTEEFYLSGSAVRIRLFVNWNVPTQGLYDGADVYVSTNGTPFQQVDSVRGGATSGVFEGQTGDLLQVKVVAVDGAGKRAPATQAPVVNYTVLGSSQPPADVVGFDVQKQPGGLLFSWTSNTELDVIGYEIREGSWDGGTVIVANYQGNRFSSSKTSSGNHTYFIRAINSERITSLHPAQASLTLAGPATVKGFSAVQNSASIVFNWQANTEPDISGYEIREGGNWASSQLIASDIASTHFLIANDVAGTRTFWIKAIDSARIQSDVAAFSSPLVAELPNRNVIVTVDEKALSFPDFRYNMTLIAGDLQLSSTASYGEYVGYLDMGGVVFARTTVLDAFDAVKPGLIDWHDATYTWASVDATAPWVTQGDLESVVLQKQFTTFVGTLSSDVALFTFKDVLTSVAGASPSTQIGTATYQAGRYADGLLVDERLALTYTVAVPAQFSIRVGARMQLLTELTRLFELDGPSGFLRLMFDPVTDAFRLEGSDTVAVTAGNFGVQLNDRLLVAISQDGTTRTLWIGRQDDGTVSKGNVAAAPIGAFTALNF